MKKVLLNSDTINNSEHIYFNIDGNFFELYSFDIHGEIIDSIVNSINELNMNGYQPSIVFIPFIPFIPYSDFSITNDYEYLRLDRLNLEEMLIDIYGISISIIITVPDQLKNVLLPT